jgi:membrane complex biogenesis BtpA family protein
MVFMPLSREQFAQRFGRRAVFGVVHLAPLPGAPQFEGDLQKVIDRAAADARAILEGGADGLVLENFGDRPFPKSVESETVAAMTRVITELRGAMRKPFGVNVLRNDALAALAIAAATGAAFIRVNILAGAMVTDQGIIEGDAARLMRKRAALLYGGAVFADHMVKHATPLGSLDPLAYARDLRSRALADALIVTGAETGTPPDPSRLEELRRVTDAPLLVGSGLSSENAPAFGQVADGAIVGTAIKEEGRIERPVDRRRVEALVRAFKA